MNATVVAVRQHGRCVGYAALAHEVPSATPDEKRSNALSDSLAARVEDTSRRLLESNALLATEIADRTQAEAARIRLLRRLVVVQEEERRRIARDLHDDLGQRLTALRLTLEASRRMRATAGTWPRRSARRSGCWRASTGVSISWRGS